MTAERMPSSSRIDRSPGLTSMVRVPMPTYRSSRRVTSATSGGRTVPRSWPAVRSRSSTEGHRLELQQDVIGLAEAAVVLDIRTHRWLALQVGAGPTGVTRTNRGLDGAQPFPEALARRGVAHRSDHQQAHGRA